MTEQPPSAEASNLARRIRNELGGEPFLTAREAAEDIDALCEQRVSAAVREFLDCAKYDALMEGPQFRTWDRSALDRLRKKYEAVRAPAERRAAEGPQLSSEASAYLAGLAEDGGYGPDDVERAAEMYPMLRPVTEEALAASRVEIDALMDSIFGPVPSALASTGEQPDRGIVLLREIALAAAHHLAGYDGDLVSSPAKDTRARRDRVEELLRQAGLYSPTDAGGLSSTETKEER